MPTDESILKPLAYRVAYRVVDGWPSAEGWKINIRTGTLGSRRDRNGCRAGAKGNDFDVLSGGGGLRAGVHHQYERMVVVVMMMIMMMMMLRTMKQL